MYVNNIAISYKVVLLMPHIPFNLCFVYINKVLQNMWTMLKHINIKICLRAH